MVTGPCATLVRGRGDSTCWCTPMAAHSRVGAHGATGHISPGKQISHHVPVCWGCPRGQPLSLSLRPAPVPVPIPGTVRAVTQHFNSSGVCCARGSSSTHTHTPGPQTVLLSWGGPGDPVPVPGVGMVGSPLSPPPPNTPSKLFISKRAKVYFCSLYRR